MLIRNNGDGSYTFFDPNEGAKVFRNKEALQEKLVNTSLEYQKKYGFINECT